VQPINHEYEELKNVQDALFFKMKMRNLTWDEAEEELLKEGYHEPIIRRVIADAKREEAKEGNIDVAIGILSFLLGGIALAVFGAGPIFWVGLVYGGFRVFRGMIK
tara:strand:+ start:116 stop:433 length:318 start_codon:yes stop_codon:yes gene_type:complete